MNNALRSTHTSKGTGASTLGNHIRGWVLALLLILTPAFGGCSLLRAFEPTEIVKHPDAPMQILEAKGNYVRVAVYDSVNNAMIEYGWVRMSNDKVQGWTLTKYDWEKFIKSKQPN